MKILWITNSIMPELREKLNILGASSGHWVAALADILCREGNMQLSIAAPSDKVTNLQRIEGKHIVYYLFPALNQNSYHAQEIVLSV